MYVEQAVYGMKTINYSLTLQQWLNYCAQLKMKIFFAVEEVREDGLLAVVLAQSKELRSRAFPAASAKRAICCGKEE